MSDRLLISSGTPFEETARYSRAVVESGWIFVSGTMGTRRESGEVPEDAGDQARLIIKIIQRALKDAGAMLNDVVRTRVYITDRKHLSSVVNVLAEAFHDIRPANTTVICQLPIPEAKVEIEVTARHEHSNIN